MNKYEELLVRCEEAGVSVDENYPFKGKLSGLYVSGNIALSDRLETTAQKCCVLAEELGHHFTSHGNILDLSDTGNRKQERLAHLWAYDSMVGLHGLITAYRAGCQNRFETAEFLGITEEFLEEMVCAMQSKYGTGVEAHGYYISFIPNLQITEVNNV